MPKLTDNNNASGSSTPADAVLLDQAMALCRQVYENPHDELLLERVRQWQKQSIKHQSSWQQAQAYWQASAKIKPQFSESGLFNRLSLTLQIKAEVVREAISQRPEQWKTWKLLGAPILASCLLLCVVLLNVSGFITANPAVQPPVATASIVSQHQTGWQQHEVKLADGTVIHLNWNTKISVTMSAQQRRVVLHRGEAQFSVAPDKKRPFIVEAQGVSATAVGTAFVVRHGENQQAIIAVSEGIVEVNSPAAEPVRLTLNQQISSSITEMGEVVNIDANTSGAWQQGMLVFRERPLLAVLTELDRYTRFNIEPGFIFDADRRVTGTYFTDRADDALALIALAFDLELEQQTDNSVVVKSARLKRPD